MPNLSRTPLGFAVVLVIELCVCRSFLMVALAFAALYISVCSYIWSCVEDLAMIIDDSNMKLDEKLSIKSNLLQYIRLHMQCYR